MTFGGNAWTPIFLQGNRFVVRPRRVVATAGREAETEEHPEIGSYGVNPEIAGGASSSSHMVVEVEPDAGLEQMD